MSYSHYPECPHTQSGQCLCAAISTMKGYGTLSAKGVPPYTMTNAELVDAIVTAHSKLCTTAQSYAYHKDWLEHLRTLLAEQARRAQQREGDTK